MRLSLLLLVVLVTTTFAADIRTAKLHLTYTSDEKMNRNVGRLEEVLGALVPEYAGASSLGHLLGGITVDGALAATAGNVTTVNATDVNSTNVIAVSVVGSTGITGGKFIGTPVTRSGTDNGNAGTAQTVTVGFLSTVQKLDCADPQGCSATITEAGVSEGTIWILVNTGTNNWTIADNGGVIELPGNTTVTLGTRDTLTLVYAGSTWVEIAQADN